MSRRLVSLIPVAENLLALQPEELGAVVLQLLNQQPSWGFIQADLFSELIQGLPQDIRFLEALGEAMNWLESNGFIANRPEGGNSILYVTRRGRQLVGRLDIASYRNATLLPTSLLHPVIAQRAQAAFLRGEYDTAIFAAFKAVEVAVRKAGGLPNDLIGTQLMQIAFKLGGPLSATTDATAEQDAVRNLFAGAIGHAKNPHSHRDYPVQPEDACHLLMFASYLLRLVDIRTADKAFEPKP